MARILVVEDDDSLRQVLSMFLVKSNHDVTSASSGEDALSVIDSDLEDFDLILTDLMLGRMSGLKILSCKGKMPSDRGYFDDSVFHR